MTDALIPITGFADEPAELKAAMRAACDRVLDSPTWILGPEVVRFEDEFASTLEIERAVGVGNGMDALEIILRARGIGPGDEVITTPMTAAATILAIMRAGATPVLADIDPETALLCIDSVKRCITPRTRAVILVHLYGQMRDLDRWTELCDTNGIDLIEDCAQSHGARWRRSSGGGYGVAGAYSFYPTKNLGAVGDGGAVVTNDPAIAETAIVLRNYGQRTRYEHVDVGLNSRLDEMQAAILSARLGFLATFTQRRREIAAAYREVITNPLITLLGEPQEETAHVYHQFVITTPQRERLQAHLAARGVPTLIHYPIPAHEQEAFAGIRFDPEGLGASENHARTCLSLPCHPQLTDEQVSRVIEGLETFTE